VTSASEDASYFTYASVVDIRPDDSVYIPAAVTGTTSWR